MEFSKIRKYCKLHQIAIIIPGTEAGLPFDTILLSGQSGATLFLVSKGSDVIGEKGIRGG
jgi:hypothetical protein